MHDYPALSRYLGEETYYFGKTNATKAWISNDMTNDQRGWLYVSIHGSNKPADAPRRWLRLLDAKLGQPVVG
jgi:hypothetical protein